MVESRMDVDDEESSAKMDVEGRSGHRRRGSWLTNIKSFLFESSPKDAAKDSDSKRDISDPRLDIVDGIATPDLHSRLKQDLLRAEITNAIDGDESSSSLSSTSFMMVNTSVPLKVEDNHSANHSKHQFMADDYQSAVSSAAGRKSPPMEIKRLGSARHHCSLGADGMSSDNSPASLRIRRNPSSDYRRQSNGSSSCKNSSERHIRFHDFACLLDAALEGDLDQVASILCQEESSSLLMSDKDDQTVSSARLVDACNADGVTALHCAVGTRQVDMARLLLDMAHANVNVMDEQGWTPLHSAVYLGDQEMTELLLTHGANLEMKDVDGRSPLQVCTNAEISALLENMIAVKCAAEFVFALYDFDGSAVPDRLGNELLCMRRGERLRVLSRSDPDWWLVQRVDDHVDSSDSSNLLTKLMGLDSQRSANSPMSVDHHVIGYVPRQFVQ